MNSYYILSDDEKRWIDKKYNTIKRGQVALPCMFVFVGFYLASLLVGAVLGGSPGLFSVATLAISCIIIFASFIPWVIGVTVSLRLKGEMFDSISNKVDDCTGTDLYAEFDEYASNNGVDKKVNIEDAGDLISNLLGYGDIEKVDKVSQIITFLEVAAYGGGYSIKKHNHVLPWIIITATIFISSIATALLDRAALNNETGNNYDIVCNEVSKYFDIDYDDDKDDIRWVRGTYKNNPNIEIAILVTSMNMVNSDDPSIELEFDINADRQAVLDELTSCLKDIEPLLSWTASKKDKTEYTGVTELPQEFVDAFLEYDGSEDGCPVHRGTGYVVKVYYEHYKTGYASEPEYSLDYYVK